MLIPLHTDRRLKRTPWVNYALITLNVLIFILTYRQILTFNHLPPQFHALSREQLFELLPVLNFYLWPDQPAVFQFVSYQFLHGGWAHLIGNMIFLWVFGNAVEDRLGRLGYLLFYLAGGVCAGLGHAVAEISPVIGASGSVAAVTGAFLALFPLSRITVILFVFLIFPFEVPAMLLILVQIGWDFFAQISGLGGNTAYLAHLAGYAFGFLIGTGLLLSRVLGREPYDLLSVLEHRRRRAAFERMTRQGHSPWDYAKPTEPDTRAQPTELSEQQSELMQMRSRIHQALAGERAGEAAALYAALLQRDPQQVLGQQPQLDVANQLMAEGRYDQAAAAYELFLKHYPRYSQIEQIQLILGLIYARYLDRDERARELLNAAMPRLRDADQQLARDVLAHLAS